MLFLLVTTCVTLLAAPSKATGEGPWVSERVRGYVTADIGAGGSGLPLEWDGATAIVSARGYWVAASFAHVGAFVGWRGEWRDHGDVRQVDMLISGISLRLGGAATEHVWVGAGVDGGVGLVPSVDTRGAASAQWDEVWAYVEPSLVLVALWPVGPVQLGFETRLGWGLMLGDQSGSDGDGSWSGPGFVSDLRAHVGLTVGFGG